MNATIGDALIMGATKIGDAISTLAPEVWRIMIRQQYAQVGAMIIAIIICLVIIKILRKQLKKVDAEIKEDVYEDGWQILRVFIYLAIIGCVIAILVMSINCALYAINPEYYAIKDLASLVSNGGF